VHITTTLGYRYLWIDRYCIPQKDSPIKDTLINNMDVIYSEPVLTIIASATESPTHALPGVSRDRTRLQEALKLNDLTLVQLITNTRAEVFASR
jgi:heterokaryon incompatibility protein (HET)